MNLNIFEVITQETALKVKAAIDSLPAGSTLELSILSGGGDAFAGIAISGMLLSCNLNTISRVYGYAASAASLIALSCKRIEMASNACLMVHSAYDADGDDEDSKPIEIINNAQVNVIKERWPEFDIEMLKSGNTWLTADEAYKLGLCDKIIEVGSVAAAYDAAKHFLTVMKRGEQKMADDIKKINAEDVEEIVTVPAEPVEEEDALKAIMRLIERLDERLRVLEEREKEAEIVAAETRKTECGNREIVARANKLLADITAPSKSSKDQKVVKTQKCKTKFDPLKFV